jgi:UDP-N-acetylglucosamine:LPS N-acetylglucosamine transferase
VPFPEYETMLVAGIKDESEESSEFILERMKLKPHYIHNMRRRLIFRRPQSIFRHQNIIRNFKPDIVHTHAKSRNTGRVAAYQLNVPVVLHTFHGRIPRVF